MPQSALTATIIQARVALHWSQRQLGENLGASMRTASRWETERAQMSESQVTILARHVYPVRADLAAALVGAFGRTLAELGIAPTPAPVDPRLPRGAGASGTPRIMASKDLVDCITYAVADMANVAPKQVRAMVQLALRRAQELGMNLDAAALEGALGGEPIEGQAASLRSVFDRG